MPTASGAYRFRIGAPSEYTKSELAAIAQLIASCDEVSLRAAKAGIGRSVLIGVAACAEEFVAAAAIKRPVLAHLKHLSGDSGVRVKGAVPELGYICVLAKHRKRGLGNRLTANLLAKVTGPIFATVRIDNEGMGRILRAANFARVGKDWPSRRRKARLALWICAEGAQARPAEIPESTRGPDSGTK